MHHRLIRTLLFVCLVGAPAAQVVYVDSAATGAADGLSWADAFPSLQDALQATSAGEVWVAAGDYFAGPPGDQTATFQLENNVALYGGFSGTETQRAQRDIAANVSTLNGDIDHDDTYGTGVQWWRSNWNVNSGNSFHIVTGSGVDATAILDGFHVVAGLAQDPQLRGGGGLLVRGGSPSIRNCTFRFHGLGFGSSAYLEDCNSVFENCVIRDAYTCNCGHGGWVSGFLCDGNSSLTLLGCDFINHYYVSSMGQGRGAALRIEFSASAQLERCRFIGNQTGNFYPIGGGVASGAGVSAGGDLVVDRCEFTDNFAHAGAGISASRNLTVTNSLFARNRAVSHPENGSLSVGDYGAGLASSASSARVVDITNCTFVDNSCDKGAGLALYGAANARVRNTIVYHNYGPAPLPGEDTVWILKRQIVGSSYSLENCCVEGLLHTEPGEDPPASQDFPGCFDVPPGIADVAGRDYGLHATSPCIGAGDNSALPAAATLDLVGAPRFVGRVDLGCLEFAGTPSPSLVHTNMVAGETTTYTMRNALPGESVFFLYSFVGVANDTVCFPPPFVLCLDLLAPFALLTTLTADANGFTSFGIPVPPGTPPIGLHVQAVILRGVLDSVATNTVSNVVEPAP